MDKKTRQLIEDAENHLRRENNEEFGDLARDDMPALCLAVKEQDKRAQHAEEERGLLSKRIAELDESNASLSRHLGGLSEMLAVCGLPSEPKALAGAIERERRANRERIAELEKERSGSDVVPTNENFVRVAMAEHCTPPAMDERYIKEWSRRFGPALDIIRARVSFKVTELEAKLAEAIDLAGEAIPYVSDYFRTKYEMDARFAKLLPDLVRINANETKTRTASDKTVE